MSHRHSENDKCLTTDLGIPVFDDESSLTVGERGPALLEDFRLIEKLSHFDRERIPERVVHAKGAGAYGVFKLHNCMKKYTKAKVFNGVKKETPVFARFSTVIGSRGSADTARDPRGFAVKFYTEEGNYDLVGNNLPVFFIRDAIKFPDMIHAFKPSPDTNAQDHNRFWDFITNNPESIHMITFIFSDRGTFKSFRTMEGFGVNTFVWVNEYGRRVLVKYHWKPEAGLHTICRKEAEYLAGLDPDVALKDLYDTLNKGKTAEWKLYVQIMGFEEQCDQDFDPLDATKTWPEDKFPLMYVGMMTLNKAPDNFFAEVEQAAFSPSNLVPGVEPSGDKLLQGRLFAYRDTQNYRLGINAYQLPVNKAKSQVSNYNQDGNMNYEIKKGKVNYKKNSLNNDLPEECKAIDAVTLYAEGYIDKRKISKKNDYEQAGQLYCSFSDEEKDHLIDNLVDDLWNIDEGIQRKVIELLTRANKEYGERVRNGLKR